MSPVGLFFNDLKLFVMKSKRNKNATSGNDNKHGALRKFFIGQLKDIYYVEKQMTKSLPELKQAATTEELEEALDQHLRQTERQIKRLEKVFEILGENPEGKKCEAMDGLLKESRDIIAETPKGSMTRDAALIIAAQKVEHYEIGTYGGLVALALTMGMNRAAELLDKTLEEEEQADQLLTDIAEQSINMEAEEEGEQVGSANKASNKSTKKGKDTIVIEEHEEQGILA